jgi:hypothetical protein
MGGMQGRRRLTVTVSRSTYTKSKERCKLRYEKARQKRPLKKIHVKLFLSGSYAETSTR